MAGRKIVKSKFFLEDDFLESLAEVPAKEVGTWKPGKKLKIVGTPVSRVDGYDKVSGTAQYTFDVTLPNMAFAKTLRCPHPHARIKSIDISKALEHPGVLAIITHKNTPNILWFCNTSYLCYPHPRGESPSPDVHSPCAVRSPCR